MALIALLFFAATARAEVDLTCNYAFFGTPTATVEISVDDRGMPRSSASISAGPGTAAHKESVTPETLAADEYLHVWISKETPSNAVEMIVYKEKQKDGDSVLINHNVPLGQEMWGNCSGM